MATLFSKLNCALGETAKTCSCLLPAHGRPFSLTVTAPPLGIVVFKPTLEKGVAQCQDSIVWERS
jgi:hypothetical protein